MGLSWTAGSSRHEITPRPSGAVRSRSVMSSCGSPKNSLPPPSSRPTSARSSTPTVAVARPPMPSSSALPSSESRNVSSARRSARSSSGRPFGRRSGRRARGSAPASRWPRGSSPAAAARSPTTVARTGTPGPMPPSDRNSTGKRRRRERQAEVGHALLGRPRPPSPARRQAGDVALDVGDEDRHARRARAARRSPAASWSCPCRSRRRPGRGGSSSPAAPGPRRACSTLPSWTPRPRSIAGPSAA